MLGLTGAHAPSRTGGPRGVPARSRVGRAPIAGRWPCMRLGHAPTYLRDADPSCPQVPEFAPIAWRRRRNHLKTPASSKSQDDGVYPLPLSEPLASLRQSLDLDGSLEDPGTPSAATGTVNPIHAVLTQPGAWRRRWTIVSLCFVAFMLCNMDRVNMSIAILPMAEQYGWSSMTTGLVQSSFFWGYLLTQVAGGVWADKYGGKLVLGLGVLWWSLATALTPVAAHMGLPALLLARACMGVGEGVAMPAMNTLLSRWVPVAERSRSLALVYSGMYTGSVLGLAATPHLIHTVGWPTVFYAFGLLGVVWAVVWRARAASSPGQDPFISDAEREFISGGVAEQRVAGIPWRRLLSERSVWALIVCHFCHNWGTFILLTWMPSYYNQVLGLDLRASGFFSVLPWITMAISANIGGWLADTLIARGVSVTTVRKVMQTIGFLGPAFFLTQLGRVHTVRGAVACMMASQGLDAFSQSGLYSNHADIGPRYAGVLLGLSNTAGVLAGVLGTAATGAILQSTGSWDQVWGVAVGLYLIGTVVWNLASTGERVFD
ncbi:PHT4D [Auxenochlorella protothecoides x Auxenochlorella symbiontica]